MRAAGFGGGTVDRSFPGVGGGWVSRAVYDRDAFHTRRGHAQDRGADDARRDTGSVERTMMTHSLIVDRLRVNIYPDRRALGHAAGSDVADAIRNLQSTKPNLRMIFAAAPSQNEMLAALAAAPGI